MKLVEAVKLRAVVGGDEEAAWLLYVIPNLRTEGRTADPEVKRLYRFLCELKLFHGSLERAERLRNTRDIYTHFPSLNPVAFKAEDRIRHRGRIISLSVWQKADVMEVARSMRPRIRNWGEIYPEFKARNSTGGVRDCDVDTGAYSRQCTYRKIDHQILVVSWAWATPTMLNYRYRGKLFRIPSPHGYRWHTGDDRISLTGKKKRYTVNGGDLIKPDCTIQTTRSLARLVREKGSKQ